MNMDIDHAQKILAQMETRLRTLPKQPSPLCWEPECEVHSTPGSLVQQECLGEISSLRELILRQSEALSMMGSTQTSDMVEQVVETCTCISGASGGHSKSSASEYDNKSFEETLEEVTRNMERSFEETLRDISGNSDDLTKKSLVDSCSKTEELDVCDDSFASDTEETDSEIIDAINEIRKEASQMDIVMALDQLKTAQTDLEVTTRALRQRSVEADALKVQLEEKVEQLSCVELERDLHKADASKLREDLKTCVDRMFDISEVAGMVDHLQGTQSDLPRHTEQYQRHEETRPEATRIPNSIRPGDSVSARTPMTRKKHSKSDSAISSRSPLSSPLLEEAFPLCGSAVSPDLYRRCEEPSPVDSPPVHGSYVVRDSPAQSEPIVRPRHRTFSCVPRRGDVTICDDSEEGKENRRCGFFRRNSRRRSKESDIAAMRHQIDQLHSMMRISLETSEKLRKRLAIISRYYEGIIGKIQEQIVETKTEKARMKADMEAKLTLLDYERKITIVQLESQLRQRDREIERLQGVIRSQCEI